MSLKTATATSLLLLCSACPPPPDPGTGGGAGGSAGGGSGAGGGATGGGGSGAIRPGDLDLSFGDGGTVIFKFACAGSSRANTAAARGSTLFINATACGTEGVAAIDARTGAPVTGFGASGQVLTPFVNFASSLATSKIVVHPDGKVTIGYPVRGGGLSVDLALAQFDSTGALNTAFGDGGVLQFTASDTADYALALDLRERLLLAQVTDQSLSSGTAAVDGGLLLTRVTPGGSLDPAFGDGGMVVVSLGDERFLPQTLEVGSMIHVSGRQQNRLTSVDRGFLLRLTEEGAPDPGFGANGLVMSANSTSSDEWAFVAAQPDGRPVVLGKEGSRFGFVLRLTPTGQEDPSFSRMTFPLLGLVGLALGPDGTIASATYDLDSISTTEVTLRRHTAAGLDDATFGVAGRVTTKASQSVGMVRVAGGLLVFGNEGDQIYVRRFAE